MFLKKYLSEINYELLLDSYNNEYLNTINEKQFIKIYNIIKSYNFSYIEEIILRYLTIFTLDEKYVEKEIINLIKELGPNYKDIISNNLTYFNRIENYL